MNPSYDGFQNIDYNSDDPFIKELNKQKLKLQKEMQLLKDGNVPKVDMMENFNFEPIPLNKSKNSTLNNTENLENKIVDRVYSHDTPDEQIPIKELNQRKKLQSQKNDDKGENDNNKLKVSWADIMGRSDIESNDETDLNKPKDQQIGI